MTPSYVAYYKRIQEKKTTLEQHIKLTEDGDLRWLDKKSKDIYMSVYNTFIIN